MSNQLWGSIGIALILFGSLMVLFSQVHPPRNPEWIRIIDADCNVMTVEKEAWERGQIVHHHFAPPAGLWNPKISLDPKHWRPMKKGDGYSNCKMEEKL